MRSAPRTAAITVQMLGSRLFADVYAPVAAGTVEDAPPLPRAGGIRRPVLAFAAGILEHRHMGRYAR
jgi:hypothetical protein